MTWHGSSARFVMSPLDFIQRLAALVPLSRLHLTLFHGVLASNAKPRAMAVPAGPRNGARDPPCSSTEPDCRQRRPARMGWARFLKSVFEIDREHCKNFGEQLRIIAAILDAPVIERIHPSGSAAGTVNGCVRTASPQGRRPPVGRERQFRALSSRHSIGTRPRRSAIRVQQTLAGLRRATAPGRLRVSPFGQFGANWLPHERETAAPPKVVSPR